MTSLEHGSGAISPDEADALARDAADPLTSLRDRFHLPTAPDGSTAIYLAGQSLGLQPRSARPAIERELVGLGEPRRGRLVRAGTAVVHARSGGARADGARRGRAPDRGRPAQQPDREPPSPARLVLPAGRAATPDPDRRPALPVGSPRADDPPGGARPGPGARPRRGRTANRRIHRPDRGSRGGHRRRGRRDRAGLPGRRQLRHRPGPPDRAADRRRPRRRRARRLGPGPRRRQHRAGAPRLGRRRRRLVHLQVPERRAGLGRRDLRPRPPRARCVGAPAGRLVGDGSGGPVRPRCAIRAGGGRGRLGDLDDVDPGPRPGRRGAGRSSTRSACPTSGRDRSDSRAISKDDSIGWASRSSRRATPRPAARSSRFASTMPGPCSDRLAARGVVADHRAPDLIRVAPIPSYTSYHDLWRFGEILRETIAGA